MKRGVRALIALLAVTAGGPASAQTQHSNLQTYTFKDSRDSRYCEIALVRPTGVEVYNTIAFPIWCNRICIAGARQLGSPIRGGIGAMRQGNRAELEKSAVVMA